MQGVQSQPAENVALVAWNINGIAAKYDKLISLITHLNCPRFICLQETKCRDFPVVPGYVCFGSSFERPQHHGAALYIAANLSEGAVRIPLDPRLEGHVVAVSVCSRILVSVYTKNSGKCDEFRQMFDAIFWTEMSRISAHCGSNMILAGDFNVCIDLEDQHSHKKNENVAGLKQYESDNTRRGLAMCNLRDVYMTLNPRHTYERWTFWSGRSTSDNTLSKPDKPAGNGWRLDYVFAKTVEFSHAYVLKTGTSDHSPIVLTF